MSAALDAGLRAAVERAAALPHFRRKYAGLLPVTDAGGFVRLPFADQSDLAACAADVAAAARSAGAGGFVFASGGTTSVPKLSFVEAHLFVDVVGRAWRPLHTGDVLLNLFAPGRLWSAHYFYNALATHAGADVLPVGDLAPAERVSWRRLAGDLGVTAIGATPTALGGLLGAWAERGFVLDGVRSVLWVGEPLPADVAGLVRRMLPRAGLWGLYGSTETWVVGANEPGCDLDTFHPLAHQHVELDGDGALAVTTLDGRCRNPIVRYRPGDRASRAACRCGRPGGVRIEGRSDEAVKFRGTLLQPAELVALATSVEGVRQAQVVVVAAPSGDERLEVHCVAGGEVAEGALRQHVLAESMELNNLFEHDGEGFRVRIVPQLSTTERSVKTPLLVRRNQP